MSDDAVELIALFDELVELDDAERSERLGGIGRRDAALRARLEAMLAADAEATGRLREHEDVVARSERPPTEDLEAYDLFLLGRESYYRYELEGTEQAMDLFGQALEHDPEFALARAWLALAHLRYRDSDGMDASWADSAVVGARQAVAQQPDLAAASTALGTALTHTGRYGEAMPILDGHWS